MTEYDLLVTWQHPDGTTVDLPATVCFRDDGDDPGIRADAVVAAIDANLVDFPDDLPEGSLPIGARFQ